MYFSYTERLASGKVEKILWLTEKQSESNIVTNLSCIDLLRKIFSKIIYRDSYSSYFFENLFKTSKNSEDQK